MLTSSGLLVSDRETGVSFTRGSVCSVVERTVELVAELKRED
jgi:hypothetical protein